VILVTILVALDVTHDYMLVTKLMSNSGLAFLPVHLNLEVLVAIKVHEVVLLVSSLRVKSILLKNFELPPAHLFSLLLSKDTLDKMKIVVLEMRHLTLAACCPFRSLHFSTFLLCYLNVPQNLVESDVLLER
jgi:hypothetical protein